MIVEHLERLGFDVGAGDVVTPAALAVRHCLGADRRRVALVMNESVKEDFAELEEVAAGAQAVIVGDLGSAFGSYAAAAASAPAGASTSSPSGSTSTATVSPSRRSPARTARARRSTSCFWMTRLSGRAP